MGQAGYLTLFSDRPIEPERIDEVVQASIAVAEAKKILAVPVYEEVDRSFELYQKFMTVESPEAIDAAEAELDRNETSKEHRYNGAAPEEVKGVLDGVEHACVMLAQSALAERMWEEMATIPVEIRGEFIPCNPSIHVGWHDIWANSERDEGTFFGRAFYSFKLDYYRTPNDWKKYREVAFEQPIIQKLQRDLEAIVCSPLKQCVYWWV